MRKGCGTLFRVLVGGLPFLAVQVLIFVLAGINAVAAWIEGPQTKGAPR